VTTQQRFQFTLATMLRVMLLFATALGSSVTFQNHRQDVTPTIAVALLILVFGSTGGAVGTLVGRGMFGVIVGLLALAIVAFMIPSQ